MTTAKLLQKNSNEWHDIKTNQQLVVIRVLATKTTVLYKPKISKKILNLCRILRETTSFVMCHQDEKILMISFQFFWKTFLNFLFNLY